MKKLQLISMIILTVLFNLIFIKCHKNNSDQPELWSEKSPEVLNVSTLKAMEAFNFLTDTIYTSPYLNSNPGNCPVITFFMTPDPDAYIRYITTYDWTENGCTGSDGIPQKGKIIVTYSGKMNVPGSVALNSFSNFYSNNDRIDGFQEIKCKAPDPVNHFPVFDVYSNLEIKYPDQLFVSKFRSTLVRTMIEGSTTVTKDDDVWSLTGSITGNTVDDIEFNAIISKPLIKKNSCKWFDSGTIVITPLKGSQCTIDYGTGTCDNKATITRDGKTIEVQL